ncbi:MAG: endonuclease/exonuclease/phosphatase family protein [Actinomycetota bacterium]|nr:endonuclease/exonuclease/phosphatase family protein [Actinomycetota bacterium]
MRVLTWNLFHGRSVPPAGRDLQARFAATLAGWDWDVALLQEVPPWWPPRLARACDADARTALTSRNVPLPALRRWLAGRLPDVIRSAGGGANTILVRGMTITGHRRTVLRRWPERRVCHAVALAGGPWCTNLHAQAHSEERARADIARAADATLAWCDGGPALLGGDVNVRTPQAPGFEWLGGNGVDHVLGHGVRAGQEPPQILDRGELSDHAPVLVTVAPHVLRRSG